MTYAHLADDNEALVAYLYGECDDIERRRVERHLAECARCASELHELQSVRGTLAAWTPPPVRLGFRIVQDPPAPARRWGGAALPAWAQLAAAVFLFAAGAAVAQLDLRYNSGSVTIRPKWARGTDAVTPVPAVERSTAAPLGAAESASAAGSQDQPRGAAAPADLTAMAETLRRSLTEASQNASDQGGPGNDLLLLRRVQAMIEQSEQKQQRELALRLAQVVRDVDVQRRADLLRVEQNFGQLEGQTGAAVAQQRELLNYLVRVSEQR